MKTIIWLLLPLTILSAHVHSQTGSVKISTLIQDIKSRYSVEIIYKITDIIDENKREFEVAGNLDALGLQQLLLVVARTSGLGIEKVQDGTYVLKSLSDEMARTLAGHERMISDLKAKIASMNHQIEDLSASDRRLSGQVDELERDVAYVETAVTLLQIR